MQSGERKLTPEQSNDNDIDWMAFCYVSNEMSANQRERFEERLSSDQTAREAVASAVELTQTIAGIETVEQSVRVSVRRSRSAGVWQRAPWIVTAVAACLAIVLGYQLVSQVLRNGKDQPSDVAERDPAPTSSSKELAQAWLEAADETPDFALTESTVDHSSDSEDSAAAADSTILPESALVETPDWMLAAVNGMSGDSSEVKE